MVISFCSKKMNPLIHTEKSKEPMQQLLITTALSIAFIFTMQIENGIARQAQGDAGTTTETEETSYAELSMRLVEAVRDGEPHFMITRMLANVSEDELYENLDTESKKKAFWLNIYNAYVQILLLENPELFEDRNSWFGYNFFSSPQVTIAGREISFDDMEHGIMRRSTIKISLGYLRSWFVDDFVERFWWEEIDPRIHFVLICGAASCPYIAPMNPDRVEEQLQRGAKEYLEDTTDYDAEDNELEVTRLISWFRGDFGGVSGAVEMIKNFEIIPEEADPSVSYKEYDWTLELGNYKEL